MEGGRCAPRCNGGLRPHHAHKHHKTKPTIKIVQRARQHRLPVFTTLCHVDRVGGGGPRDRFVGAEQFENRNNVGILA